MGVRKLIAQSVVLFFANCGMICFVVMSGEDWPRYQYAFAVVLAMVSIFSYLVIHFALHGFSARHFRALGKAALSLDAAPLIGAYWACNYVFVLIANPYTPGVVQVVLNELNLVVVVVYSRFIHKKAYSKIQYGAVVLALIGGLVPVIDSTSTGVASSIPSWAWYIFYTLGTVPVALANVRTEHLLQGDRAREISVPLLYCAINTSSTVVTLALFWFPAISAGDSFWSDLQEGFIAIWTFQGKGAIWTWLSIVMTFPNSLFTAYIERDEDATYATLVLAAAPALSGIIMGIKPLFGPYYQPVEWTSWLSLVIVLVAVFLYKILAIIKKRPKAEEQQEHSVNAFGIAEERQPLNVNRHA